MTRPLPPCQALLGWPLLPIGPSGCTDDAAAGADHARAERSVKLCGEAGDIVDPDRRLCSAGSRREIIVPGGRDTLARRLDQALILAIARAKVWMRDLRARKYADTKEIAQRFQLSDAHVRRILRFGYLAPDHRSDYRRPAAALPDGQALASRHSLRVGRSTCRVRVCFLSAPATVPSHLRRVSPPIADDPKRDAKIGRQRQAPLLAASCSVLRHRDKPARGRGRVFAGLFHKNQKIRKNNDCVAEEAV